MLGSDEKHSPSFRGLRDKCRRITIRMSITDTGETFACTAGNRGRDSTLSGGREDFLERFSLCSESKGMKKVAA